MAQIYRVVCQHLAEVRQRICRPRLRVGDQVRIWEISPAMPSRDRWGLAAWLNDRRVVIDWDHVIATRAGHEIGVWCREVEAEPGLRRGDSRRPHASSGCMWTRG